ncbi:MAG TPA: adenosylcobinamide-GDP ribazoletransferase [Nitrososphaera sp.]|nr:adenosylcobinamide-GDP ribazoletransferase [Nitrososphaera sp.]
MAFLRPVQAVLAFLTVLPAGKEQHDIYYVAKKMYHFPAAGIVIGAIVGAMAFGVSPFLHPLIVGLLVTGALVIITGVHHTDALADFADGLMAKGGKELKRKAMRDPAVGSAGVASLVMYFAGMIVVFDMGTLRGYGILAAIITAEVVAKYLMVLLSHRGMSAWEGFSSPFTAAMKDRRKVLAATAIMLATIWVASGYAGLAALAVSLGIAAVISYASAKSFGGISGDVLGATNEMTRLASLLVLASVVIPT